MDLDFLDNQYTQVNLVVWNIQPFIAGVPNMIRFNFQVSHGIGQASFCAWRGERRPVAAKMVSPQPPQSYHVL